MATKAPHGPIEGEHESRDEEEDQLVASSIGRVG